MSRPAFRSFKSHSDPSDRPFCSLPKLSYLPGSLQDFIASNAGFLLIASSQGFFALVNVAVKMLDAVDPAISTFQLIAFRMSATYIGCMAYMLTVDIPDPFFAPKGVRTLLAIRGISGFFSLLGIYYSLGYLSLSDATVLTYLAPMFTALSGAVFLRENFTIKQALASLASLIGVILIARPTFLFQEVNSAIARSSGAVSPSQRLLAVGVALVGVLGQVVAYTIVVAVGTRAHALHSLSVFSMYSIIAGLVAMILTNTSFVLPSWRGAILLAEIGTCGFIAQVMITVGLQYETAGRGTMAVYTQVIFATLCELTFFQTFPGPMSLLGNIIIVSSALYIVTNKAGEKGTIEEDIALEASPLMPEDDDEDDEFVNPR